MFHRLFLWLARLFGDGCNGGPLRIIIKAPGIIIGGNMTISIGSGSTLTFGLQLAPDASGNPNASLPGPVTWAVDNASQATLAPSADGLTVVVTGSAVGDFNLTATSGSLTATQAMTTTAGVTTGITIVQEPAAPAPAPAA